MELRKPISVAPEWSLENRHRFFGWTILAQDRQGYGLDPRSHAASENSRACPIVTRNCDARVDNQINKARVERSPKTQTVYVLTGKASARTPGSLR